MAKQMCDEERKIIEECYIEDITNISKIQRLLKANGYERSHPTINEYYKTLKTEKTLKNVKINELKVEKIEKELKTYEYMVQDLTEGERIKVIYDYHLDLYSNKDKLDNEIDTKGVTATLGIFGTILDKIKNIKHLDIKYKELEIRQRQLELEEQSNNTVNIKIVDDLGE